MPRLKISSILLAATLAVPSFLVSSFVATGDAAAQESAVVVTDLNVRTGPGTGYPRISTIPGGSSVEILGCTPDNWCDVVWFQLRGWVSGDYLDWYGRPTYSAAPPPAIVIQPYPVYRPDWRPDWRHDRHRDWRRHGDWDRRGDRSQHRNYDRRVEQQPPSSVERRQQYYEEKRNGSLGACPPGGLC